MTELFIIGEHHIWAKSLEEAQAHYLLIRSTLSYGDESPEEVRRMLEEVQGV